MIVGADIGKYQTRIVHGTLSMFTFPSKLVPYRELKVENDLGSFDFIIDLDHKKYFGGDLADREKQIPIAYTDESKAHKTTLLNLLCGLHKLPDTSFEVVLSTPIGIRTDKEKKAIQRLVDGSHDVVINNERKTIKIKVVGVAPEGATGFWSEPIPGEVQGFDFGSTTINYFVMKNKRIIDSYSGTFPFGFENSSYDPSGVMEGVSSQLANKFDPKRKTMLMGGLAEEMYHHVKEYYPKAYIVQQPIFATAIGCYKLARSAYERH